MGKNMVQKQFLVAPVVFQGHSVDYGQCSDTHDKNMVKFTNFWTFLSLSLHSNRGFYRDVVYTTSRRGIGETYLCHHMKKVT